MFVGIEIFPGIEETSIPIIKLTKSKSGKTGTATFIFINPKSFINFTQVFFYSLPISSVRLIWNNNKIVTTDVDVFFYQGKPLVCKAIFIFRNSQQWFEFFSFMNSYSKEIGLSFFDETS